MVDLNFTLGFLETRVPYQVWQKIVRKIRSHSDRANSKGTLSEIALMTLLTSKGLNFDLETKLTSNGKDIDIQVDFGKYEPLYIEVQWLSPSDVSERGAAIASAYDEAYSIDYTFEEWRIKQKVYDKTSKLTLTDITFVALDCTLAPELGGSFHFAPIGEAILEAFTGKNAQGNVTSYANSDVDKTIRQYVDGVIWFELEPGNRFIPIKRGYCINPTTKHSGKESVTELIKLWTV